MNALLKYHNAAIKLFYYYSSNDEKEINSFLMEHNDSIIDIQITGHRILIVYKYMED